MYPYISLTEQDVKDMLDSLGVNSVEDLFSDIPEELKLKRELNIPKAKSELEVYNYLTKLASKNASSSEYTTFLGAGAYDHYIPAVIPTIISRSEFLTSYTPYQPEISQGTLQYIFEFQTMISNLTGMEYANASLYDQGTSLAEAAIMTAHHAKKKKVLVSEAIAPWSREVLKTYLHAQHIEMEVVKTCNGVTCIDDLKAKLNDEVGAVLVQNPNFFGNIEDVTKVSELAHGFKKCYSVVSVDPSSLGALKKPSDCNVDVVVGEAQSLGIPISYGGPYLGFMAATEGMMRKLPGRIVGQTEDHNGKTGYVLTLQAREQHIRREKASSNICSNQALCALAVGVYMSAMGSEGIKEAALQSTSKAHYLAAELDKIGFKVENKGEFFHEFVTVSEKCPCEALKALEEHGILGGYPLGNHRVLWCCTEMNTKEEMDEVIRILKEV